MDFRRYLIISTFLMVGFIVLIGIILAQNKTEETILKQTDPTAPIVIEPEITSHATPSEEESNIPYEDDCPEGMVAVYEGGQFDGCHLPANGPECETNTDCEINEHCIDGTCYENENEEIQTCSSDKDCPIINCANADNKNNEITTPCPSYKCIEQLCVLID